MQYFFLLRSSIVIICPSKTPHNTVLFTENDHFPPKFKDALLRKHKHLYEKQKTNKENGNMSRLPLIRSLAEIGRNHSSSKSKYNRHLS